jgi:Icc-related predicted phosphoesterase
MAHLNKLLAVGAINGAVEPLEQLLGTMPELDVDVVVAVGDLTAAWQKADAYRAVFKAFGKAGKPTFWVPGPVDAPIGDYLRESANIETVYPFLHGVHGTFALGPGPTLFAGLGGEIVDDPDTMRVEEATLRYPGWEVEYRLKFIRELKDYPRVLLFTTPPAHKGLHGPGSEVLAELINTYRPRLAFVAGEHPTEELLGKTHVVCPGSIGQGHYVTVDFRGPTVEAVALGEGAAV